ncbi:unnamed protein product [Linum trigynum]|uniref:Uncharacterized protein n=1 Tax=Linum trigynum TaxID=586398 RepID=A0AAV2FCK7_9ROSI
MSKLALSTSKHPCRVGHGSTLFMECIYGFRYDSGSKDYKFVNFHISKIPNGGDSLDSSLRRRFDALKAVTASTSASSSTADSTPSNQFLPPPPDPLPSHLPRNRKTISWPD